MTSFAIRLEGVSRIFHDPSPTYSLKGVDLAVETGEFVAIMGASGAGKSTLLNLIGLLDAPTEGRVIIGGKDTSELTPHEVDEVRSRTVGFVFQSSHLMPYETTARNVALGLSLIGVPWPLRRGRVARALSRVGLLSRAHHLARNLSGGERQRAAVARAIATDPEILLADEPTGNLDSRNSTVLLQLLRSLNESGVTVVMVTHDAEAAQYADRTIWMADGAVSRTEVSSNGGRPAVGELAIQEAPVDRLGRRTRLRSLIEVAADALSNLTTRPGRAIALVTAFLLGTGTLVAAAGLGESASAQIADRITQAGLDEVQVVVGADVSAEDRQRQRSAVAALDFVEAVGVRVLVDRQLASVSRSPLAIDRDPRFSGFVVGADSTLLNVEGVEVEPSSALDLFDDPGAGRVAIIGEAAAEELGISTIGASAEIWVRGRPYTVIGVVTEPGRDPTMRSSIVVPASTLSSLSSTLVVRTMTGYPAAVADAIPLQIDPGNPGGVEVSTVADLRALRIGVSNDLGGLVAAVALVLLLMATLSAGTALYLSIQSRLQELALRRALGARRSNLAAMFVIEGALIGLAGGMAGVALGTIACAITCLVLGWTAVLPPVVVAVGIASGLVGGVISSIIPAAKAAQINPADAIR